MLLFQNSNKFVIAGSVELIDRPIENPPNNRFISAVIPVNRR